MDSRKASKRAASSAPATPRGRSELGEYRVPLMMAEEAAKKARNEESIITTAMTSLEARSITSLAPVPSAARQSPASVAPSSPASLIAISPTRKESYKDLIIRAISNHPDKLMTLSDIYAWIVANIEAYRDQSNIPSTQGWKNAIRHTLSFYKCFKRVKRHPSIEKPSYWTIDYHEQQASAAAAAARTVPPSPKSSPLTSLSTCASPATSSVIRAVSTAPGVISSVIKEPIPEARRSQESAESGGGDLRSLISNTGWLPTSEARASKEEQCIQGLLLFRTSAGFSFLPKSSGDHQQSITDRLPSTTPSKPLFEASVPTEHASYVGEVTGYETSVHSHGGQVTGIGLGTMPRGSPGEMNGSTAFGRSHLPTGTAVTMVVDSVAGTRHAPIASTWTALPANERGGASTLQILEQEHAQRKHPQKRYAETTQSFDPSHQQPKQESLSYVQLIANAILASPQKRATLAQVYEWLVRNVAAFKGQEGTPSSVGWKNAVRHTLSTRPFFNRVICEEAFGRQKPAWWTVDVEAMTLASTLKQQQQSQLRVSRRRRNGHDATHETAPVPQSPIAGAPTTSVIRRASVDVSTTKMLEKSASLPLELVQTAMPIGEEEMKWVTSSLTEKEAASPLESTPVFRLPSLSISSGTTTSTISTSKSELVSPAADVHTYDRPFDLFQPSDLVKGAIFESAVGLDMDVFDCLLKYLTYSLDNSSSWFRVLSPRDALLFTLLRLRRHPSTLEFVRHSKSRRQLKRLYVRWLALLSSRISHLIVWPGPDISNEPPTYLVDRLIALERMRSPENVLGVLDIFTMEVMFDDTDECCRWTVNAVLVYNLDGAVIYRSKLYWLGCRNHGSIFQAEQRSMIEDCIEKDLKERLTSDQNGDKILLSYLKAEDILPSQIHVVRSKSVRNLLREKFADRLSRFDILAKPIALRRKASYAVTTMAYLDDTLTVCAALLNLSAPIAWDYAFNGV